MNEDQLKQDIKNSLNAVTDGIDGPTQARLHDIRHQAVFQPKRRRRWMPVATVASSLVLGLFMIWQFSQPNVPENGQNDWLSDVELLAAEAETEFYEDLEFLTWLEESQLLESDI